MHNLVTIALAGLILLLQNVHARNIQAVLDANLAEALDKSSLLEQNHIKGYNTILNFDDVPTVPNTGIGLISSYIYLNFTSFVAVDTLTAASHGTISTHAIDCAFSHPNALFSARLDNQDIRPRWVADRAKLHAAGLSEFFNLNALSIKPLGDVPRGFIVEVIAWEIRESAVENVYNAWIVFPEGGYQGMEHYDLTGSVNPWGRKVNMVEIFARVPDMDEGEGDGTEWAFCLDDLEVEFLEKGVEEGM